MEGGSAYTIPMEEGLEFCISSHGLWRNFQFFFFTSRGVGLMGVIS